MNLTFAAQLNKMITAGLGGAVEAPETGVAVGRRVEYTSIGPASILTFEANSELPFKALSINLEPIQEGSGEPSPENVRPISGRSEVGVWREATYDTSVDPALRVQLGQTVYGGTVDVVSGVMTLDRAIYTWNAGADSTFMTNAKAYAKSKGDVVTIDPDNQNTLRGAVCDTFPSGTWTEIAAGSRSIAGCVYGNGLTFKIQGYTTTEEYETFLTDNPITFAYLLKQPVSVQLTAQQLTTLLGTNNVWSDADAVSLTYGNIYYTEGY